MKRWLISVVGTIAATALLGGLLGPMAGLIGAIAGILWTTVRHDNHLGTCLPLVILFLVILGVLTMLTYLLLITHAK
jgi:hypothetical protein